jgi:hypothetical protein
VSALANRCRNFLSDAKRDGILRGEREIGPSAEDLEAFVISEIARAADDRLDDSLPLCLYFSSKDDREEFVAAVIEAKPNMISKRWPE